MPTITHVDPLWNSPYTVPPYAVVSNAARDTGTVKDGWPASLLFDLTAAAGELRYATLSPAPTIFWCGFWWRMNTADEPAGDTNIAWISTTAGQAARLSWQVSANNIYHFWSGGGAQVIASSLDAWHWIECIVNVSANPNLMNTRVNDVDITDVSNAVAASTVQYLSLQTSSITGKTRYAGVLSGTAASDSDWLGMAAAHEFHPNRGVILDASIAANSVSKQFELPWELDGLGEPNVLGNIPTTATVPQVWEDTVAPTIIEDSSAGYSVGDIWVDTALLEAYWCVSAAVGAAVWKKVAS